LDSREVLDLILQLVEPFGGEQDVSLHLVVLSRVRRKEKPAQIADLWCAQAFGPARHGSTALSGSNDDGGPQSGDELALLGERLRALQRVLDGGRAAEALDIPGVALAQVARGAHVAEMLLGAVHAPGPLLQDLLARGLGVARAENLFEQPGVPERAAREHDRLGARVLERPADVLGL